jgi:hypothetical protein
MPILNLLAVVLWRASHFSVGTQERILFGNHMYGWFLLPHVWVASFPVCFAPQPSCVRVQYHEIFGNLEQNKKYRKNLKKLSFEKIMKIFVQ